MSMATLARVSNNTVVCLAPPCFFFVFFFGECVVRPFSRRHFPSPQPIEKSPQKLSRPQGIMGQRRVRSLLRQQFRAQLGIPSRHSSDPIIMQI